MIKSEINLHWNFCGKRVWGEVLSSSLGTQTSGRLGPRKVQEGGEEKEWKWNVFVRVLCHATTCKCKDFIMAVWRDYWLKTQTQWWIMSVFVHSLSLFICFVVKWFQ
jgi:hypothetical protein